MLQGEVVSNHDELMCNFFAQADALATGKTAIELRAENVPDSLIPHKTFTGNRPSTSVLLPELTAYTVGQILSLYENRIAVQVSHFAILFSSLQAAPSAGSSLSCEKFHFPHTAKHRKMFSDVAACLSEMQRLCTS